MQRTHIRSFTPLVILLTLAVSACGSDDDLAGPGGSLVGDLTASEFQSVLVQGPTRIEIKLRPGELVAREVEVEDGDHLTEEEEIESRIADIENGGGTGALILELGNLRVEFDGNTEFRDDDDELTLAEFVARVQALLDDGQSPWVEAERAPAADPQDPDDATFVASKIELEGDEDDDEEFEIEINVDADNVELNDAPPPDGWITVLGLRIELRVEEGITEIESKADNDDGDEEDGEFEGLVSAVDLDASSVTLTNGTIVRIVAGTKIESDDNEALESLQAVADALDAGQAVEAEGKGVVESTNPLTIVAEEVEFEIEDEEEDD